MSSVAFMWKSLFRRRVRTILTMASLLTAFLLFVLLRSVSVVFELGVDLVGADRLSTASKFSMIDSLPLGYMRQIKAVKGVSKVTHMDWFGGTYQDENNMLVTFAVEPASYFEVYSELQIAPDQLEAFIKRNTGMLALRKVAEKHGWEIGDQVSLMSNIYRFRDGSNGWEFELVGVYDSEMPFQDAVLIQHDYLNEAQQGGGSSLVGWYGIRLDDPARAQEIAREIDSLFENSGDPTRTSTEAEMARQWMAQIGDISLMMSAILSAVFFTMILLAGNTMMQSMRERIPEIGVMKTLGFSDLQIFIFVLGESLMLCGISAILGIALGSLVVQMVVDSMAQQLPILLTADTIYFAIAVSIVFAVAVGLVPSVSAARMQIVDALRSR